MLELLRKYQKSIFILVTAVVIVTFTFFGAARGGGGPSERREVDYTLGKAIDGKEMHSITVNQVARFLASDCFDVGDTHLKSMPNIFNDGVLRHDLLESGIAAMVVQAYLGELQVEFDAKYDNFKRYKPYSHPKAPFLSAEAVWGQFAPQLASDYADFCALEGDAPMDVFNSLVKLYLGQGDFPAAYLQQVLHYQMQQMEWVGRDPRVEGGDFSLFYAHTPVDWFGHRFMQLMAQTVINSAKYANILGFVVTNDEARASLIHNGKAALKRAGHEASEGEVLGYLHRTLGELGMSEKDAVSIWKRVLKMRRLFESAKAHTVVDPLIYRNFNEFSQEEAQLEVYRLPRALELLKFEDLMRFETYIDAVGSEKCAVLSLPRNYRSVDQVEKKAPDLVHKRYLVAVKEARMEELCGNVGVKEMWAAQSEDGVWKQLCERFGYLVPGCEGRKGALDGLNHERRLEVDAFTRRCVVERNREWIELALEGAKERREVVHVTASGRLFGLDGFESDQKLSQQLGGAETLECVSGDGEHYYDLRVIDRDAEPTIATFEQCVAWGVLDEMLDQRLEIYYPTVRMAHEKEFKNKAGAWKGVDEVREELGKLFFAKRIRELKQVAKGDDLDQQSRFRFHNHLQTLVSHFKSNGSDESFIASEVSSQENELPLVMEIDEQFKLVKSSERAARKREHNVVDGAVFRMKTGEWSDVASIANRSMGFYKVISRGVDDANLVAKMQEGRELLARDAARGVMSELLREMVSKEAIHFQDIKGLLADDEPAE